MQQSRTDNIIDFLLKAAVFTWVNYGASWAMKQTPLLRWSVAIGTALIVSYLLTYIIHPWRRSKRAERRAAKANNLQTE